VADSLERIDVTLQAKPVVYGGLAMEYYGLRPHGDDIDLLVTEDDETALWARFPKQRKDMWGDLGVLVDGVELFRSVYRLDAAFFGVGATEFEHCRMISSDRLLVMKWLATGSTSKNEYDLELLKGWFLRNQNSQWEAYMQGRVPRYLAASNGVLRGSQIEG
jgi:hypothetical protein